MMTGLLQGPMFRLNIVVMSSLAFLAYGLRTPSGPIEVLQLPVAAMQVYFIAAMLVQVGWRGLVEPLSKMQLSLIGALLVYIPLVSLSSPIPSAHILFSSWMIHILFFVALIVFFRNVRMEQLNVVWPVLGLTGLIHVGAFMVAWSLWPDEVARMQLPAFGHIRHLTYLLAPAAAVMAILFLTRLEHSIFPLVCFSAAAFYILYTGSRGGALALIIGLVITSVFSAWQSQKFFASRFAILLAASVILVLVCEFLPAIPNWPPVFGRAFETIDQTSTEMLTGRDNFWSFAWASIQQNVVWGYGPAILSELPNYREQPFANGTFFHPHNLSLQLLLHWGMLGTLLVLATASTFVPNALRARKIEPQAALLAFAVASTMGVHALVDGGLFYPFSIVIAIIALAMLDAIGRNEFESSASQ